MSRTEAIRATQSITIESDQIGYTLNADFMRLYLRDSENRLFIKYNDGSNNTFLRLKAYEEIILDDQLTSVNIPTRFSITDDPTLSARNTGTASSSGTLANGETTLTASAADFANVSTGDAIHNTTDGSDGYVLSKTSSTVLVTALFGGTDNDWDTSDAFTIQPQGRLRIVLDPPPSEAGHTVSVEYVQRPPIVASDFGVYRFASNFSDSLIKYAALLYRYKDREPDSGDAFFRIFERAIRMNGFAMNRSYGRTGFSVNFKKRS